jgi:ribonuclease HII
MAFMPGKIDPTLIPQSPDLRFEKALWAEGIHLLAGIDEAGRGAWAGPVTAAAVILPESTRTIDALSGVRDSKQIPPAKRESLAPLIKGYALGWAIGFASVLEIDALGILPATRLAMHRAIEGLMVFPAYLLLDALFLPDVAIPQTALIKGDQRSLSIAAASILAKTSRDTWMVNAHEEFGCYGFNHHKGYGTKEHHQALLGSGSCPLHRLSFKPLKEFESAH